MNPDVPTQSTTAPVDANLHQTNQPTAEKSKIGAIWISLAISMLILLLLLIFIMQNSEPVRIKYLGASGTLGFGVAMLLAAVIGSILTLLIGTARILQLKAGRKSRIASE